jgi:hypothetical protein
VTHLADFEFKRESVVGERLPTSHQRVCNASLPAWPEALIRLRRSRLPSIFLCELHAKEVDLECPTTEGC